MWHSKDRIVWAVSICAILLLAACQPVESPTPTPAPAVRLDDATVARMDEIVERTMIDVPIPGVELCVVKDGQVVYSKGFGMANLEEERPATPHSLLVQGSVTKSFVAMAIMALAEQGVIDLDASVTDYLPDFSMADERYKAVTVRMLLSHTGGLPDSPSVWSEALDPAMNPLDQAVDDLREMELLFDPESDFSYSSYGYSALGAIIEAVTGQPFERAMQVKWLEPLGMIHSTFVVGDVDPTHRMTLYRGFSVKRAQPVELYIDGRDASAGGLWSSCDDMVKWAQLLQNGGEVDGVRLLEPASMEAMWTPVAETGWLLGPRYDTLFGHYGLGWFVGEKEGVRLVGHMGAGEGVNTQFLLAPDEGLAVIAMANWMDFGVAMGRYPATLAAADVMVLLLGLEP